MTASLKSSPSHSSLQVAGATELRSRSTSAEDVRFGEEKARFSLGIFVRVRGMDGVALLGLRVELANGTGFGLRGIGRTDGDAQRGDGVVFLEDHRHAGA